MQSICHYYLNRSHTQKEGDSVHALIERTAKRVNVYDPYQWYTLVRMAKKKGEPYSATEMKGQMLDFHPISDQYCKQLCEYGSSKKVEWKKIKCLMTSKQQTDAVFIKYCFDDEDFTRFNLNKRGLEVPTCSTLTPLPDESTVTTAQKKNLLWMCSELIIPRNYHDFYHGLRMTNSASVDVESDEMNAEKKRHQHKC